MEIVIFSISSCFALFSFYNLHKENEGRRKIQWLSIIVLLVINIFLFNYMVKCYEVPIHNNRISYFISNSSKYKSFTGYSNINLIYDYNTFKELKKTNFRGEPIENEPGIETRSYIKCNKGTPHCSTIFTTSYGYFKVKGEKREDHDNFGRWYKDGYMKLVEDSSYISFLEKSNIKPSHFEVDVDENNYSVTGVLFMLETNSSNRQSFLPFKTWKDLSYTKFYEPSEFEYSLLARNDSLAPHHDSVFYNHQWSYSQYYKLTRNSIRIRYYRYIPEEDSIMYLRSFFTNRNFIKPNLITTAEDISQAVEVLWIDTEEANRFNNNIKKITYDYNGPVEFSAISPEPDYIDISSLYYTDSLKIKTIVDEGLKFHVKFPDMENLQIIRMWIVTLLLGGFLGLLLKLIYSVLKERYVDKFKKIILQHKNAAFYCTIVIIIVAIVYIVLMVIGSRVDAFNLYDDKTFWIYKTN